MTLKTYHGSCHCGAVRFEADLDLTQSTYRCNCSICRRTRFWAAVARPEGFRLLAGEAALTEYRFNTRRNQHFFCRHCGVRAFGVGNDTPIGKMFGINLGCLDDASDEALAAAPITYVDGRDDRWQQAPAVFLHL
ncbi:MAG TPA: GFA family protein [Methylibium sp.]|nr:GFA family protein [Methylibium sp.]